MNFDECFTCFIGEYDNQCLSCGNFQGKKSKKIIIPSKVLIIALKRKEHTSNCDIDFPLSFDISKYCSKEKMNGIDSKTNYNLKSCISLNYDRKQYFADI